MAAFFPITKEDMDSLLLPQGFHPLSLDGTRELVYGKRIDADGLTLTLRVYTGINPDGNSRDVGEDAIRCNIFWKRPDGEIRKVASSKRVHRVMGWKKNLQARIDSLHIEKKCSVDGSPMVLRKGRNGEFYGCANYPNCNHTERV